MNTDVCVATCYEMCVSMLTNRGGSVVQGTAGGPSVPNRAAGVVNSGGTGYVATTQRGRPLCK